MKKLLSVLLAIVLLISVVPMGAVTVSAADAATISVNNVKANTGETVDVVISLANNPGIVSMRLEVAYDANVLEFVSKAPGDAFGGMAYGPDTANPYILNWVDTINPNNKANGTFVTLTFRVKDGAAIGKSDIEVYYNEDDVYDQNFDNVHFETVAGSVTVLCKHANIRKIAAVEATCTTAGNTEGKECLDCGEVLLVSEVINALGHKEVVVGAKDATCVDAGYTGDKICKTCYAELAKGQEIAAYGHNIVEVKAKKVTCTEDGNIAHFACETCATTFADIDGAEVAKDLVIKATGHSFTDVIKGTASCTQAGTIDYKTCLNCAQNFDVVADAFSTTPLSTIVSDILPHDFSAGNKCPMCELILYKDILSYKIANGAISITGCQQDFAGKMVIPDTIEGYKVKIIGENAFRGCTQMTEVIIPEGVVIIKDSAFAGCTSLERVSIPSTVTSISSNAFGEYGYYTDHVGWYYDIYDTNNINRVDIADLDAWLGINFVTSASNPLHCGADLYLNGEKLTSVTVSDDFTRVNNYAFYGCTSLETVTMANSVTTVGAYAFEGCTALNSVTFGNKLNTISDYAFWGCFSLKNVVIPSSVGEIGWEAFRRCPSLESVTICDAEEYDYYSHYIGMYAFADCTSLKTVNIGNTITSIGEGAFSYCTSLEDISIGERVGYIGSGAFDGCNNIKRVYINDISKWLCINFEDYDWSNIDRGSSNPLCYGADLYVNGEKFVELVIPQDITYIRGFAFNGCLSIEKVVIHSAVTNISAYAFNNCDNITQIDYYGTKRQWNAIGKGNYNDALYLANIEYIVCENHVYDGISDMICNVCAKERQYVPGDLNGKPDGEINNKDLGVLMQYLNGWKYTEIVLQAADINGDGAVNNRDYGILMRYLNGWDIELK